LSINADLLAVLNHLDGRAFFYFSGVDFPGKYARNAVFPPVQPVGKSGRCVNFVNLIVTLRGVRRGPCVPGR
jgi:hypothetical protein